MSKKQGDESDLMADFFGEDDLDWLDDEAAAEKTATLAAETAAAEQATADALAAETAAAEQATADALAAEQAAAEQAKADALGAEQARAEMLPVAPPPPPAFKPAPSSAVAQPVPLGPKPTSPAPPAAATDTWDEPVNNDEPPGQTLSPPELVADSEPDEQPVHSAVADSTVPPVPVINDDDLEEEPLAALVEPASEPQVGGQTPPLLVRVHEPAAGQSLDNFEPLDSHYGGVDTGSELVGMGWQPAITRLVREAQTSSSDRGALLYGAACLARRRLRDTSLALSLLEDARVSGYAGSDLHRERATAHVELGRWSDAEAAYAALGEVEEPLASSEAWQEAAGAAVKQDNSEGVLRYLRYVVQACPTDVIALTLLRDQLPATPDNAAERQELTRTLADFAPGPAAAELWWESAQEPHDDDSMVEQDLRAVLSAEPEHTAASIRLRNLLVARADHEGCAALFRQRAEVSTGLDTAWWSLRAANSALIAGDTEGAASSAQQALQLADTFEPRWLSALTDAGAHGQARQVLAQPRGDTPAHIAVRQLRVAQLAERMGDPSAALVAWEAVLEQFPELEVAQQSWERISKSLQAPDPVAQARAALDAETDSDRRSVRAYLLGTALERAGDLPAAKIAFEEAGSLPGAAAARYRLSDSAQRAEIVALLEATESSPERAATYNVLLALGCPDVLPQGRAALETAFDQRPSDPAVRLLRSVAIARMDCDEDRLRALDRARQSEGTPAERDAAHMEHLSAQLLYGQLDGHAVEGLSHTAALSLFRDCLLPEEDRGTAQRRLATAGAQASRDQTQILWWSIAAAESAMALGLAAAASEWLSVSQSAALHAATLGCAIEGALASQSVSARLDGLSALLNTCEADDERAVVLRELCEELATLGSREAFSQRVNELLALPEVDASWTALAWSAELLGEWRSAVDLLERANTPRAQLDQARLVSGALADPVSGLRIFRSIDDDSARQAAAVRSLTVSRALDDGGAIAAAHAQLASGEGYAPFRAAQAGWAADEFEHIGDPESALAHHLLALRLRPSSQTSFQGARRLTLQAGDVDGLIALYDSVESDRLQRAEDLETLASPQDALTAWEEQVAYAEPSMPVLAVLEQLHRDAERYEALVDNLTDQRDAASAPDVIEALTQAELALLIAHMPDSDKAFAAFARVNHERPDDRIIAGQYAKMAGMRGETSTAVQTLTHLAETAEHPEDAAHNVSLLGDLLAGTGDADGARQAFLDALDHVQGYPAALAGLRSLAQEAQDSDALLAVLRRELEVAQGPERVERLIEIAEVTAQQGDSAATMDAWRTVVDEDSANERGVRELYELASSVGDDATTVFAGGLLVDATRGDERAALLRRLGEASVALGDRDAAQTRFEQAISEEPPDMASAEHLCALYERSGAWQALIRVLLLRAEHGQGDEATELVVQAAKIALSRRQDRALATSLYSRLLELEPEHRDALMFCADAAYRDQDYPRAAELYGRLGADLTDDLDLDDFDERLEAALIYHQYGVALIGAGRSAEARAPLERAIELDRTHLPSLEQLAPLYRAAGDFDKASEAYRNMLQLARGLGDSARVAAMYVELGLIDHTTGDDTRAAKRFSKALEMNPNNAGALLGMALIYEDQEDYESCWKSYNAVINIASDRNGVMTAYLRKGRVLDERKERLDKAAEHYERCLEVEPDQPVALLRLAEVLLRMNRAQDAATVATRGLAVDDVDSAIRADMYVAKTVALAHLGQHQAADEAMQAARQTDAEVAAALEGLSASTRDELHTGLRLRLPRT